MTADRPIIAESCPNAMEDWFLLPRSLYEFETLALGYILDGYGDGEIARRTGQTVEFVGETRERLRSEGRA